MQKKKFYSCSDVNKDNFQRFRKFSIKSRNRYSVPIKSLVFLPVTTIIRDDITLTIDPFAMSTLDSPSIEINFHYRGLMFLVISTISFSRIAFYALLGLEDAIMTILCPWLDGVSLISFRFFSNSLSLNTLGNIREVVVQPKDIGIIPIIMVIIAISDPFHHCNIGFPWCMN